MNKPFVFCLALFASAVSAAELDADAVAKLETKAEAGDAEARLALGEHYLSGGRSPEDRAKGERWLRRVVIDQQEDQMRPAIELLHTQLEPIRAKHANLKPVRGSVGVALDQAGSYDESVDVLVREAWLLTPTAQIYLDYRYYMNEEGAVLHDPRILAYFEESAAEGLGQSRLALAYILIRGAGVEVDTRRASELLQQAGAQGFSQAYLDLRTLSVAAGDEAAAERWCGKAAELGDSRGLYCLGMYASARGEDEKAFRSLEKVSELDPDAASVRVQLARWHIDGKGTPKNREEGFAMMKQVADGDSEDRVEAQAHVGAMYSTGTGVEKSQEKGRAYLERAAAAGHEGAADWLERENEAAGSSAAEPAADGEPRWSTTMGSLTVGSGDETATFTDLRSTCNAFRLSMAFGSAAAAVRGCLSGSETRRVFLEVQEGRVVSSTVEPDDEAGRCVTTALGGAQLAGLTCTLEASVSR